MTAIETLMGKKPRQENDHEDAALVVTSMLTQEADVSGLLRLDVLGITDTSEIKSKETLQKEL